jgi:protein TonB
MTAEVAVMLQVAMANRANAMHPATDYRRAAIVLGAVIAAHLALLVLMLVARDRTVERTVEPRTITALLLSPEPAPATPAAAAARPTPPTPAPPAAVIPSTPPATRPAIRVKPAPQPRPRAAHSEPTPAPVAAPENTAQPAAAPPVPVPAPATASTAAPSPEPAPAAQTALPASTEPRNVSHVDCSIPKPDYPDISKRRRENGTAVVRFVVGLTGRIETAQLQKSSGYDRLNDAALAAVHAGACQPYRENGQPVRAAYSQSFVFGLTE